MTEPAKEWVHQQQRPPRRAAEKHAVKFIRGMLCYQAGEVAGFPLDRAYQITGGFSVEDMADMDPERLPNALIVDKAKFEAAMRADDERRENMAKAAARVAAKRANKAAAAAELAAAAKATTDEQNRRARERIGAAIDSQPTDHDKLVAKRRK